jgi:hypothetical protein
MSASPEFYQPAAAPAYTPRVHLLATKEPATAADDDRCCTPTGAGINYISQPTTCPPAPRKPRPPPTSACRKRLFTAADVVTLSFDDIEAIFRPASEGKQGRRSSSKDKLGDSRRTVATS